MPTILVVTFDRYALFWAVIQADVKCLSLPYPLGIIAKSSGLVLPPPTLLLKYTSYRATPQSILPPCKRHSKVVQASDSQHAQPSWERFPTLQSSGNGASGQHNTRQQREFNTVGLAVLDAVAAESVERTNAAACYERRDGACTEVASDTAACGEGGEDEGDLAVEEVKTRLLC